MEWEFVTIVRDEPGLKPLVYPWAVLIDSVEKVLLYDMEIHTSKVGSGYWDYIGSKECSRNMEEPTLDGRHCTHPIAYAFSALHTAGKSLIEILDTLNTGLLRTQFKMLETHGHFYMQRSGGLLPPSQYHRITGTVKSDKLVFPQSSDTRYIQWPGGKHWYAKVGDLDVVVDGKQKWDTKTEAEEAVKKWFGKKV